MQEMYKSCISIRSLNLLLSTQFSWRHKNTAVKCPLLRFRTKALPLQCKLKRPRRLKFRWKWLGLIAEGNPNGAIKVLICTQQMRQLWIVWNIGNQWVLWNFIKRQYPQLIGPHNLMDCTKKIISWLYGEGVNAQTWVLRIGELGQFVQSKKK